MSGAGDGRVRVPDQRDLLTQLTEVVMLADREGYYDAADWIGARMREQHGEGGIHA